MQLQRVFEESPTAVHSFTHSFLLTLKSAVAHVQALIACTRHRSLHAMHSLKGVAREHMGAIAFHALISLAGVAIEHMGAIAIRVIHWQLAAKPHHALIGMVITQVDAFLAHALIACMVHLIHSSGLATHLASLLPIPFVLPLFSNLAGGSAAVFRKRCGLCHAG